MDIGEIGLVHLSGVEDTRPREALTDNERIMLSAKDQLQSCEQVKTWRRAAIRACMRSNPSRRNWQTGAKTISAEKSSRASR